MEICNHLEGRYFYPSGQFFCQGIYPGGDRAFWVLREKWNNQKFSRPPTIFKIRLPTVVNVADMRGRQQKGMVYLHDAIRIYELYFLLYSGSEFLSIFDQRKLFPAPYPRLELCRPARPEG